MPFYLLRNQALFLIFSSFLIRDIILLLCLNKLTAKLYVIESANAGIICVGGCVAGFFSRLHYRYMEPKGWDGLGSLHDVCWYHTSVRSSNPSDVPGGPFYCWSGSLTQLSEVFQLKWRVFSLGFYHVFWYGGGIIASAFTYGTSHINSSSAWRIPSMLQVIPSIFCLVILPFITEPPRWLMYKDRQEEDLEILAIMAAGGDISNAVVMTQYH